MRIYVYKSPQPNADDDDADNDDNYDNDDDDNDDDADIVKCDFPSDHSSYLAVPPSSKPRPKTSKYHHHYDHYNPAL